MYVFICIFKLVLKIEIGVQTSSFIVFSEIKVSKHRVSDSQFCASLTIQPYMSYVTSPYTHQLLRITTIPYLSSITSKAAWSVEIDSDLRIRQILESNSGFSIYL